MRTHRHIANSNQQPAKRHYQSEHEHYDRDEMENRSEGGDYYDAPAYGMPNGFGNRDYSNANYNFWPQRDEPQYSNGYIPSADYGYELDEYYSLDPSHEIPHRGQATGYGNEASVQAMDFERWAHQRNNDWDPRGSLYERSSHEERDHRDHDHFANNRLERPHAQHEEQMNYDRRGHNNRSEPDHFFNDQADRRHAHHEDPMQRDHRGHSSGNMEHSRNFDRRDAFRRNHYHF